MGTEFRLPNITAGTAEEQIRQISSYLYQLVGQLTWTLDNMESGTLNQSSAGQELLNPRQIFASIKSLITDAEDIAEAYLEELRPELDGLYVQKEGYEADKEEIAGQIAGVVQREEISAGGFTWQKCVSGGMTELWGISDDRSWTEGATVTVSLPVSMSIKGVSAQAVTVTPATAYVLGYNESSVSLQLSASCDGKVVIHAIGK